MQKVIDPSQDKFFSDELSCGENKNAHVNNPGFFSILNGFQDVDSSLINFKILSLIKILSVPSLLLQAYSFCEANRQSFWFSVVNMPRAECMIADDKNLAYTYSAVLV